MRLWYTTSLLQDARLVEDAASGASVRNLPHPTLELSRPLSRQPTTMARQLETTFAGEFLWANPPQPVSRPQIRNYPDLAVDRNRFGFHPRQPPPSLT